MVTMKDITQFQYCDNWFNRIDNEHSYEYIISIELKVFLSISTQRQTIRSPQTKNSHD